MGFLSFLTGAMTGSAQRHFAYAIGQGDAEAVNRWFNASLLLHAGLAVLLVVIGLPFGWYMLDHVLTIPPGRLSTCHVVFLCTLAAVFVNVLAVPFTGMFTAKQRIFELSAYQFVQTALMFGFAYMLTSIRTDRLAIYAIGVTAIALLITGLQIARCYLGFKECQFKRLRRQELRCMRELVSFAGWTLFGAMGVVGSNQGIAFLINIFCGPKLNASFGISNQVSGQMSGVSQGLFNAISPEITASEGCGNRDRVITLALRASKFSTLLACSILIPVLFEMNTILELWLKEVPSYTATLSAIMLIAFLIDKMTIGYMAAIGAYGVIAGYQATLGGALLCAPLIAWYIFYMGGGIVWAVGVALLVTRTVCSLGRILWVKHLMQVPISRWVWGVAVRCMSVVLLPLGLAVLIHWKSVPSFSRLLATLLICGACTCVTGWIFGLDRFEREYLISAIRKGSRLMRQLYA